MKERIIIFKYSRENPNLIINSSSELYGACRHKPKLHRYAITTSLPVLMTNNSSKRLDLTLHTPPISNIPSTTCTYVREELSVNEDNPLAHSDVFESGRSQELSLVEV